MTKTRSVYTSAAVTAIVKAKNQLARENNRLRRENENLLELIRRLEKELEQESGK